MQQRIEYQNSPQFLPITGRWVVSMGKFYDPIALRALKVRRRPFVYGVFAQQLIAGRASYREEAALQVDVSRISIQMHRRLGNVLPMCGVLRENDDIAIRVVATQPNIPFPSVEVYSITRILFATFQR